MKIGIFQFKPHLGAVDQNLRTIKKFLARPQFDLAVLPELATTGYNFLDRRQLAEVAESKGGPAFQFFEELSVKKDAALVWGAAVKSGKKIYNSAVLTTPEGDHHIYHKIHLFYREKLIFDPGQNGFKVFKWRGFRIGLMVCFDWIFPESVRSLALKKAQIICHPANLVLPYCQDAMVTRSLENRVFCFTANRIGREDNGGITYRFTGSSRATDPTGKRILTFTKSQQMFKTVKIKPDLADIKKVNLYNDLFADRKTGQYSV